MFDYGIIPGKIILSRQKVGEMKEYIKELSIVILGILIAFWINNLGNSYKEKSTQKLVLQSMLYEMVEDREAVDKKIKNTKDVLHTFEVLTSDTIQDCKISLEYYIFDVSSVGYETAKYSGIFKDLNYDLVSQIIDVHESVKYLKEADHMFEKKLMSIIQGEFRVRKDMRFFLLIGDDHLESLQKLKKKRETLIVALAEYLGQSV